jgi:hypothetical protein
MPQSGLLCCPYMVDRVPSGRSLSWVERGLIPQVPAHRRTIGCCIRAHLDSWACIGISHEGIRCWPLLLRPLFSSLSVVVGGVVCALCRGVPVARACGRVPRVPRVHGRTFQMIMPTKPPRSPRVLRKEQRSTFDINLNFLPTLVRSLSPHLVLKNKPYQS